jgi:hypothetical protein
MIDTQRSKVYAWENAAKWSGKGKQELTDDEIRHIYKELDRKLKRRRKTKVVFTNRRSKATASWTGEIKIPRDWARCWSVVLHEYAHLLTFDLHGPSFVSAFCVLLKNFHPDRPSYKELSRSLNEKRIQFKSLHGNKYEKLCKRLTLNISNVKTCPRRQYLENTLVRVAKKPTKNSSRVDKMVLKIFDYLNETRAHTEYGPYRSVRADVLCDNIEGLTVSDIKYFIEKGRLINPKL